ncbi:MAG: 2-phospho-L-lactate transferase [Proteobacteria bacterium]|nr:2-phospho-L-lactate transferase [Pseudomonadota bacterium]
MSDVVAPDKGRHGRGDKGVANRIVVLSGGVGGARLVDGLAAILPDWALTAIINTGDDFIHWGLTICPDLDTVMYTLAGLADPDRGWGLRGETFRALAMMQRYRGPSWFGLGDGDLATHLVRSQALARGESLSDITARLCRDLGVQQRILPMADQPHPTAVDTAQRGTLLFQEWFVRERCRPVLRGIHLGGTSEPAPGVLPAIDEARFVIVAPSNPYVSIDPIMSLDGVRDAVAAKKVVAVSPIVAGKAVKGPLADMIRQIGGQEPSAGAIAGHYGALLDGIVVERGDEGIIPGLPTLATDTIMKNREDRMGLAGRVLAFGESLL